MKYKFIPMFALIFGLLSANQKENRLVVRESFSLLNTEKVRILSFDKSKPTIVKYLVSGCSICTLELQDWTKFISDNKLSESYDVVFVVGGGSKIDADYLFRKDEMGLIYLYDPNYTFMDDNQISADRALQTLLVDKKGNIKDIGNPFGVSEESKAFKNNILED